MNQHDSSVDLVEDGKCSSEHDENNAAEGKAKWKKPFTIAFGCLVAVCVVTGIVVTIVLTPPGSSGHTSINFPVSPSVLGTYQHAAVAADAGKCSEIGTQVMKDGGSAVDGALAATICTGAINMHNSGIGGGFFMTIWDNENQIGHVVNAREMAPHYASRDMFEKNISSVLGPYAIAVPGEIAGYWEAHQKFGKVSWKALFEPTIKLCNEGFPVSDVLSYAIGETVEDIAKMADQKPFQTLLKYMKNPATGDYYKAGETIKCQLFAKTLETIANNGGRDFYNGSLAKDILEDLKEIGSMMNSTDLATYDALWMQPIEVKHPEGFHMISTPPPGSGAILGFILNILAVF